MKVTFTINNMTQEWLDNIANMSGKEAFENLSRFAYGDLKHIVKIKIGTGQFRDRVELNSIIKSQNTTYQHKLEHRKGYKLVTFEIK